MKKKILALTLAVTLVVSIFSVAFTVSAASTLKGDADGDGKLDDIAGRIDASDAIIEYNGVEYKQSSSTFNINGLTIYTPLEIIKKLKVKITGSFIANFR